ncbi:MAG: hypothetical protein WAU23_12360 [Ferruginibacter sp.]
MTTEQINNLVATGKFPDSSGKRTLVETHISWVILGDQFVYKIKKPVNYSFLNFSTPEKRKHFCEREILLNKRLTKNVYLDVQPVNKLNEQFIIGGDEGVMIDYAVRMHKLETEKQMDKLLLHNRVTASDIKNLAEKIAAFHKETTIIYDKDFMDIGEKFNDLEAEKDFINKELGEEYSQVIREAIAASDDFMEKHKDLLAARLSAGLFRDGHGDLHARNIFLLPEPVPFDCIEFNDDFRQIDVLNEVAFLCMDLDAIGRQDLSALFIDYYNQFFPCMKTAGEHSLFIYYKSYRANIRAKVNSLRAKTATDNTEKIKALAESKKYLLLMDSYLKSPELLR